MLDSGDDAQGDQGDRVDMQAISINWEKLHQQQEQIGSQGIHLYIVLRSCGTRRNPHLADCAISELAEKVGWSEQNVRRYLRALERAGLIVRIPNKDKYGRDVASSYQLLA